MVSTMRKRFRIENTGFGKDQVAPDPLYIWMRSRNKLRVTALDNKATFELHHVILVKLK